MSDLKIRVVRTLEEMALRAEMAAMNPFKVRAYNNGARIINSFDGDIEKSLENGELAQLSGIGPGTLAIIKHVINGEAAPELEELRALVPDGVLDLTRISGLGPKRARMLWQELDIKNLGELEYALKENRLQTIKGMGPKMEKAIAVSLSEARKNIGHFRLDQLFEAFQAFQEIALMIDPASKLDIVGEGGRAHESTTVLEIAWLTKLNYSSLKEQLDRYSIFSTFNNHHIELSLLDIKCVIHLCNNPMSFGAEIVWLSSDEGFRNTIIDRAQKAGFSFTRYGLFKGDDLVATPDEHHVFDSLKLHCVAKERREAGAILVNKREAFQKLIEFKDLRGAFHNHTQASDGNNTLEEMRHQAIKLGLSYLSINDHSHSAAYAHGLDTQHIEEQLNHIEALNSDEFSSQCWIFSGTESDILADGSLDFPDSLLLKLDVVIASVHSRLKQDRETMTARMLKAAAHPSTTIIGHPTGRLILDRPPSDFDMEALISTAKRHNTVLELNANPHRLDLNVEHLIMAKEAGVLIAINPDAHSINGIKDLEYGILIAKRAGLKPEDVLNCFSINDMKKWLKARGNNKSL